MDLFLLIVSAVGTLLYCHLSALDAARMDACEEPDFLVDIDQHRTPAFMHHWSEIYARNPALHCMEFQVFICNPRGYMDAHVWRTRDLQETPDLDPAPLLPRQMYAADKIDYEQLQQEKALHRLEQQYGRISNSNGHYFAPMQKRRPRKWQTRGTHLKHA